MKHMRKGRTVKNEREGIKRMAEKKEGDRDRK